MKKLLYLNILTFIIFILCAYLFIRFGYEKGKQTVSPGTDKNHAEYQISEQKYEKDGITAAYPKIISGASKDKLSKWNKIIENDINKILDIYSFQPFPELAPSPEGPPPIILNVTYDIKANNEKFFSVLYTAAYNSRYSAHPTSLVYSTNIDKLTDQRLRLPDIIKLDTEFAKDLKNWELITDGTENPEVIRTIHEYVNNLSEKDILQGLLAADQIGSKNYWGYYSYLTPKRLGISLSLPNFLGDHAEFERDFSDIKKYLKMEMN